MSGGRVWTDGYRDPRPEDAGRRFVARILEHHGVAALAWRNGSVVWANSAALDLVAEEASEEDPAVLLTRLGAALDLPPQFVDLAPGEEQVADVELRATRALLRPSAIAAGGMDEEGPVVLVTFRAPLERAVDPAHLTRVQAMLDSTSDIITVLDRDGRIRVSNPAAGELTGIPGTESNGASMLAFVHPEDADLVIDTFARGVLAGEDVEPIEVRIRMADGEWHHTEASITGQVDIDGDEGHVVTVRDISDRVRRDTEAVAHRRRLEIIVGNIDDVVVILDADLSVLWASPGIEGLIDAPAYTNVGESAFNDMHPDDVAGVLDAITEVTERPDRRATTTFRLHHERFGWRWIDASVVNQLDEPAIGGLVCTMRDVTEQRERNPELHRLRQHERDEVARLRDADRLKDRFLATVSHELRTPLTSVRGFSSILEEQWDDLDGDARRRLVGRISANAFAMEDMIEQLLDFSRLQAGRVEVHLSPLELDGAIAEMVDTLEHQLRDHAIVVEPGGLRALADRRAFDHVLRNLLTNAIRYSNAGTRIEVTTEPGDHVVRIRVRDHGIGIASKDQARVFQSFFQAAPGMPDRRGTGVGLNVARRYTQLQNGSLTLESELGVGSTFTLTLAAAT